MSSIRQAIAESRRRAARTLIAIGREIRDARRARGLSQRIVAEAAGLTQPQVSLIERGRYPSVRLDQLAALGAAVGLDIAARTYPGGQPLRDRAHVQLFERLRLKVASSWSWASEVPLPIPGDRRAWDRMLRGAGIVIGAEGEIRPTDAQELGRRLALKRRDGGVDRMILVLADTGWNRSFVRLNDLEAAFPVPSRVALRALAEGRDPGGDAIILV